MAITGGMKFFEESKSLFKDGASAIASTGSSSAVLALDKNRFTFWRSSGSSDVSTETVTITLPTTSTIDRLFIVNHNFKGFRVRYENGGGLTDFTNVNGIDGALGGGILETDFSDDTAYYEFDAVSVDQIEIEVTTTQVADDEKFMMFFAVTSELGTLDGYPIFKPKISRNIRRQKMLSGRYIVEKSEQSFEGNISFRNYPPSLGGDLDLMFSLVEKEDAFMIWPCGGRRGNDFFRYELQSWRLRDLYSCQIPTTISPNYANNVYTNVVNLKFKIVEVV